MAQILLLRAHRKYQRGPLKSFECVSQEHVDEIFRLPVSVFTITFGRRPSAFCGIDVAAQRLLATLNLVESNELFEIGRAWILDVLYNERRLPRLRDLALLTKKQSIKDAFCVFRKAMRENAGVILPNFGLMCCNS